MNSKYIFYIFYVIVIFVFASTIYLLVDTQNIRKDIDDIKDENTNNKEENRLQIDDIKQKHETQLTETRKELIKGNSLKTCWCGDVCSHRIKTRLEILVVSWGGVSTTNIIKCLKKLNFNTNDVGDWDHIKHMNDPNHPRLDFFSIGTVLYVFDDPINAILSLFRRDYHYSQVQKLTNGRVKFDESINSVENYLDKYSEHGDVFELENHFNKWYESKKYKTIFIRASKIYDKNNLNQLKTLLNNQDLDFGQKKKRNSDWKSMEDIETKEKLLKMYGKLIERLEVLDDISVNY